MSPPSILEPAPWRRWWRALGGGGRGCVLLFLGMLGWVLVRMIQQGAAGGHPAGGAEREQAAEGMILAGVAWAVGLAVASQLPVWGFLAAGLWLGWHAVALMGAWTGTPFLALPVLWWLAVGLGVVAWRAPRDRVKALAWWLPMAFGAGYLVAEPSGWSRLPGTGSIPTVFGKLLMGGGLAAVGAGLLPLLRRREWTAPGFGKVLGGSLLVMGVGLGASAWRDGEAAAGWAWGVLGELGFLSCWGWFWLGGIFAGMVVRGMERAVRPLERFCRDESGIYALVMLWLGVTMVEWMATRAVAGPWADRLGLTAWLAGWPPSWRVLAHAHGWTGVVVVALGVGLIWQGGEEGRGFFTRLNALWLGSLPLLAATAAALPGHGPVADWGNAAWWGPPVLLGVGAFGAVRMVVLESDAGGKSRLKIPQTMGILTVILVLLVAAWPFDLVFWAEKGGGAALLGMLHLAVPRLVYSWWNNERSSAGCLPLTTQVWLGAAGMAGVLPMLQRDPDKITQLALCPILWLGVLLGLRAARPTLDPAAGVLAGSLLGSCSIAAWLRPDWLMPSVPLISWLNPPSSVFPNSEAALRPYFTAPHFTLWLLMTLTGALLGLLIFRGKPAILQPVMPLSEKPVLL